MPFCMNQSAWNVQRSEVAYMETTCGRLKSPSQDQTWLNLCTRPPEAGMEGFRDSYFAIPGLVPAGISADACPKPTGLVLRPMSQSRQECSQECFRTACEAHLANLAPWLMGFASLVDRFEWDMGFGKCLKNRSEGFAAGLSSKHVHEEFMACGASIVTGNP